MTPKRDFNIDFPFYRYEVCPLTNQGLKCSYTGVCLECPFRLLLTVVNMLYDNSESSFGFSLRNVILRQYGF